MTIVTDTRGGLLLPGHGVHRGHEPHVDGAVSLQSVGRLVSLQVAAAIAAIHVLCFLFGVFGDSSRVFQVFTY